VATNITVKTKFRVNGQEYASVDDMPPAIRQAYERAMASVQSGTHRGLVRLSSAFTNTHVQSKITFNGQVFDNPYAMPPAMHRLYDDVMATLNTERRARQGGGADQAPLPADGSVSAAEASALMSAARPESTTARLLIAGAVIVALLLVSFVLRR
jgi:hypothetical protein